MGSVETIYERGGGVEEYMYVNMLFCWNKDFPETEKKDFPYFCVMWLNKDDSVHVTKHTKCGQQKTYVINIDFFMNASSFKSYSAQ